MKVPTRKKYNYFKLFAAEFVVETVSMTSEERSAYVLLLCHAWMQNDKGTLPTDDASLARFAQVTPEVWSTIKDTVLRSFQVTSDRIEKIELVEQWQDCEEYSRSNARAANIRWGKDRANVGTSGPEQEFVTE